MSLEVVEKNGLRWYPIGGKLYPSVTTALGWVFHYPGWARYDLNSPEMMFARKRGRAVHKACYWIALGRRLMESTVDPILEPYITQFRCFLLTSGFRTEVAEFRIFSRRFGYAGRGDLKGYFPGDPNRHLIDIKTGTSVMGWLAGFQTAAYLRADREESGDMTSTRRSILQLNGQKPHQWRLKGLNDPDDFTHFISALNIFKVAERENWL